MKLIIRYLDPARVPELKLPAVLNVMSTAMMADPAPKTRCSIDWGAKREITYKDQSTRAQVSPQLSPSVSPQLS